MCYLWPLLALFLALRGAGCESGIPSAGRRDPPRLRHAALDRQQPDSGPAMGAHGRVDDPTTDVYTVSTLYQGSGATDVVPHHIAADPGRTKLRRVYASDTRASAIWVRDFNTGSDWTLFAGQPFKAGWADGPRVGIALFERPHELCVGPGGHVFVLDSGTHTGAAYTVLRRIDAQTGAVTTVVGNPTRSGSQDGSGASALLSTGASSVLCGSDGEVLIGDHSGNGAVRRVTCSGNGCVASNDEKDCPASWMDGGVGRALLFGLGAVAGAAGLAAGTALYLQYGGVADGVQDAVQRFMAGGGAGGGTREQGAAQPLLQEASTEAATAAEQAASAAASAAGAAYVSAHITNLPLAVPHPAAAAPAPIGPESEASPAPDESCKSVPRSDESYNLIDMEGFKSAEEDPAKGAGEDASGSGAEWPVVSRSVAAGPASVHVPPGQDSLV